MGKPASSPLPSPRTSAASTPPGRAPADKLGSMSKEALGSYLCTIFGLEHPEVFARHRRAQNLQHDEFWRQPNRGTGRTTSAVLSAVVDLLRAPPGHVVRLHQDHPRADHLRQAMFIMLGRLGWPHEEIARRVVWAHEARTRQTVCHLADHADTDLMGDGDVTLTLRTRLWSAQIVPLSDTRLHQTGADRGWRYTWITRRDAEGPDYTDRTTPPEGEILWWKKPRQQPGPAGGRPSQWRFTCTNQHDPDCGAFNVARPFRALRDALCVAIDGRASSGRGPASTAPRCTSKVVQELLHQARALPESGTMSRRAMARALQRAPDDYAVRRVHQLLRGARRPEEDSHGPLRA